MEFNEISIHFLKQQDYLSEDQVNNIIDRMTDNEFNGKSITSFKGNVVPAYSYICNNSIKNIDLGHTKKIEIGAFEACENLLEVSADNPVVLNDFCFSQCFNLIAVNFICENIPQYCFNNCNNLKIINIADNVNNIGDNAFNNCYELQNVRNINPETIGICAFTNCVSLRQIDLGNKLTFIGAFAFSGCNLTKIIIPKTVKYIETEAFSNNVSLLDVVFETEQDSEIYFNNDVFKNCPNIRIINKNNNPYIDEYKKANNLK